MKLNAIALTALAAGLAAPAGAAAASDSQVWTNAAATVKLGERWRLQQEFTGALQRQARRPLRNRVQQLARLPAQQGRDDLGRLHSRSAICGRRFHRDGAPGARAGDVRRLRQARQGQAQRPRPARAALARRHRRHRLASAPLSQIFASHRRQDRAQLSAASPSSTSTPRPSSGSPGSTAYAISSPSRPRSARR